MRIVRICQPARKMRRTSAFQPKLTRALLTRICHAAEPGGSGSAKPAVGGVGVLARTCRGPASASFKATIQLLPLSGSYPIGIHHSMGSGAPTPNLLELAPREAERLTGRSVARLRCKKQRERCHVFRLFEPFAAATGRAQRLLPAADEVRLYRSGTSTSTQMPCGASSCAKMRVSIRSPALETE